jgi:hypothetical protein
MVFICAFEMTEIYLLDGCPPHVEAKARALKEVITWMGELELSRVIIELDYLLVVNTIT